MALAKIQADHLEEHLRQLCEAVGNRLAGTEGERLGAQYIASHFVSLGLPTEVQEFPCVTWRCDQADLQVKSYGRWQHVPVQPNTQSPATAGVLEAELVYLETGEEGHLAGRDLQGKIGLLFGSAYSSLERLERLCNSGLAALLYVDDRFPTDWKVASGLIAGWIDLLTIPTATIPYMAAWEIVRGKVKQARLRLEMETFQARSQNVVATLPGREDLPPLVVGGHHDSVALGVGAEDDGSGVAVTMELARVLAAQQAPRRPVKFVTFGWEENLSEGSRHYVINPVNAAADTAFMINFDSVGCWMGKDHVYCTGEAKLRKYVADQLHKTGFLAEIVPEVSPYSDHFAFNLVGVPAIWFHRSNFPGGRFYHHSDLDQVDVLDFTHLAATGEAAGVILADLAESRELPFPRSLPAWQRQEIEKQRRELLDCVCDWRQPKLMRPVGKPWRDF